MPGKSKSRQLLEELKPRVASRLFRYLHRRDGIHHFGLHIAGTTKLQTARRTLGRIALGFSGYHGSDVASSSASSERWGWDVILMDYCCRARRDLQVIGTYVTSAALLPLKCVMLWPQIRLASTDSTAP